MTPTSITENPTPARWANHVLDAWRQNRALRDELRAALDLLHEQHVELDRLRARYHALLDERRAARQLRAA
jgi:hypothetical protein